MSTYKAPTGAQFYSQSEDSITFANSGHTALLPRTTTYRRVRPNASGNSGFEVKVRRGISQADGTVRDQLVTLYVRPVPGSTASTIQTDLGVLDTGFFITGSLSTIATESAINQILPSATDILP